jgi:hypothetical protein
LLLFSVQSCSLHQHRPNSVHFGFRVPLSALAGFHTDGFFVLHFLVKQRPRFRFSTHRHANRDAIPSRSTRQRSPEGTRHNTPRISRRASVAVILLGSYVWKNFLPTSLTDITPSKCSLSLSVFHAAAAPICVMHEFLVCLEGRAPVRFKFGFGFARGWF